TGTPAAAQAALNSLVFQPAPNQVAPGGSLTTDFILTLSDGFLSTADATTSLVALSVNDAPLVSNAVDSGASVLAPPMPFGALSIADVDLGETVTVTAQVADPARGDFTTASLIAAGFSGSGGTYTFTG